jgi:hypothetical protein
MQTLVPYARPRWRQGKYCSTRPGRAAWLWKVRDQVASSRPRACGREEHRSSRPQPSAQADGSTRCRTRVSLQRKPTISRCRRCWSPGWAGWRGRRSTYRASWSRARRVPSCRRDSLSRSGQDPAPPAVVSHAPPRTAERPADLPAGGREQARPARCCACCRAGGKW